ncbi:MAG: tetratricopeptide repeat protein, partial [Leptospiraceae bacterium]|nr:tetratricopeptide repeat protein [Leptospiraceae bacterium]
TILASAQERGVTPLSAKASAKAGSATYAIAIGISDYQDPAIPDLRFADRDAEAFANFLRSPAGGALDNDHLKILVNAQATAGKVGAELYWLLDEVKEGDEAIIYFSGHGDVERKTISQPGYLLCWDAPAQVYLGGGALALPMFQDIISTLSTQNKARVIVITDACRSGKLAGSKVGGAQITGANLAQKVANEIKILSCQPNEFSIEGEQWGGGRGAFSYHLIDGLYGMADADANGAINLLEIGRYLEDHVSAEVAPQKQLPMTEGNRTEQLTAVVPEILAQVRAGKLGQLQLFSPTESRGIEDEVLVGVDTSVRKMYRLFKQALKDKVFLEPESAFAEALADKCADAYYQRLIQEPKLARLHNTMTRNYAAALQDDAQQVLNKWMKMDVAELSLSKVRQASKYRRYPRYLERAAELLGPEHYMYAILQARKLYFEGYLMHIDHLWADRELGEKILAKYRESLHWLPESPQVYLSMMNVQFLQLSNPDSAEYYAHLAMKLAPTWILPYSNIAFLYARTRDPAQVQKGQHFLELADQIDTAAARSNPIHMANWAFFYRNANQGAKAEAQFKKMLEADSASITAFNGLGAIYTNKGQLKQAEFYFKKAIAIDSTNWAVINNLGLIYLLSNRLSEAEQQFQRTIEQDPVNLAAWIGLATVYAATNRSTQADSLYQKIIDTDPDESMTYINIGSTYLKTGQFEKARRVFEMGAKTNPGNALYKYMLGWIYLKSRQLDEAARQFEAIIALDSAYIGSLIGHGRLALLYARQGYAEKALEQLELADPSNNQGLWLIGAEVYGRSGQLDKAFEYLEKAFQTGFRFDFKNMYLVNIEEDLAPLKAQTARWDALLKKYFPEQVKD